MKKVYITATPQPPPKPEKRSPQKSKTMVRAAMPFQRWAKEVESEYGAKFNLRLSQDTNAIHFEEGDWSIAVLGLVNHEFTVVLYTYDETLSDFRFQHITLGRVLPAIDFLLNNKSFLLGGNNAKTV